MRSLLIFLNKQILWLARHWELVANGMFALVLGLAVLAPAFMSLNQPGAGLTLYRFFAPHDHQLPQRSYFLFSPEGGVKTYAPDQLMAQGAASDRPRSFYGTPETGYKMALNHRMTAIFLGLLAGGLVWSTILWRPTVTPALLTLLVSPMFLDALSHLLDERNGWGLRTTNGWALWLTGNALSPAFYTGDVIGSLNWWLRTVTGLLFGLATAWYLFPYLDRRFREIRKELEPKLRRIGVIS